MRKILNKRNLFIFIIFLFYLGLNLQILTIKGLQMDSGSSDSTLKIYHILSLFVFPFIISGGISVPPFLVLCFFLLAIINTSISFILFSNVNLFVLNYIFAFYCFIIGLNILKPLKEKVIYLIRIVSVLILLIVIIKDYFYRDQILTFLLDPYGHPVMTFIYGGGPNLEATWISLSSIFFLGTIYFFPYLFISLIISVIYASRVGVLIVISILLVSLFSSKIKMLNKLIICILLVVTPSVMIYFNPFILERFSNLGSDPGSIGRLTMWKHVWDTFTNSPLYGYGAGNAVPAIEKIGGILVSEDNVHNYYIQTLLDFGIINFIIYLFIIFRVLKREIKSRFKSIFGFYILIYSMAAFVQFKGADPLLWFIFGLYEAENIQKRGCLQWKK